MPSLAKKNAAKKKKHEEKTGKKQLYFKSYLTEKLQTYPFFKTLLSLMLCHATKSSSEIGIMKATDCIAQEMGLKWDAVPQKNEFNVTSVNVRL